MVCMILNGYLRGLLVRGHSLIMGLGQQLAYRDDWKINYPPPSPEMHQKDVESQEKSKNI